jgi:hypothetical protein
LYNTQHSVIKWFHYWLVFAWAQLLPFVVDMYAGIMVAALLLCTSLQAWLLLLL